MRDCLNTTEGHIQAGSVTAAEENPPDRPGTRKEALVETGGEGGGDRSVRQCDPRKCEATAEGGRPTWDKGDKARGGGAGRPWANACQRAPCTQRASGAVSRPRLKLDLSRD